MSSIFAFSSRDYSLGRWSVSFSRAKTTWTLLILISTGAELSLFQGMSS